MTDLRASLTENERGRLDAGFHEEVAASLTQRGRPELAGWVLEQIWDWDGALSAYRSAAQPLDTLRVAIESGAAAHMDAAMADLESATSSDVLAEAIRMLQARRRPMEAARLLAKRDDPRPRAEALLEAGDRLGAARCLAQADAPKEALDVLTSAGTLTGPTELGLAAHLCWDLGDAVAAARYAQRSLRAGSRSEETRGLLARALGSLGHDLAAQMVLAGHEAPGLEAGVPGRYRVTGRGPPGWVGAAYVGVDRVTLHEVEIHLLLAEQPDVGPVDPDVMGALRRFATVAEAAARLGHPAIRPILRLEPQAGLLVLPRAEGPSLRSLIRPPGMVDLPSRARALVAFVLEGLQAAHDRGLVHGWLLPSQIASDAAGRPMLGPFGAHHLAGLAATHTGSLEEIMAVTAPELRRGGRPTVGSDVYAMGAVLAALLVGRIGGLGQRELPATPEAELARAMMAPQPEDRPPLRDILERLRRPVADMRELELRRDIDPQKSPKGDHDDTALDFGVAIDVAESWTDALLTALCREANPWMQSILDRRERQLVLAAWPAGCRSLGDDGTKRFSELLPAEALQFDDPELQATLRQALRPSSLVRTPSGDWMIALDDLLSR